jgi:hypothetical protein
MVVLVGSFFLLSVAVTFGMVALGAESTPLWVVIMGVFAVLGIVGGFGLMLFAGWQTLRESRKVEILPPEESGRGAG